nr:hypothetical transcript [Hymenolepis microstoma]
MFASFGVEVSDLTDSTCSRIVAKPSGKTDKMKFSVGSLSNIEVEFKGVMERISIVNGVCTINGESVGEPCFANSDDVIITINDTAQFKSLSVAGGKRRCFATFVPKCEFKPVKSGALIPQAAFPFAKFVEGERSVNITFSVKGLNSISEVHLKKDGFLQCKWNGTIVENIWRELNCLNLTENSAKDQLDGTVVYKRVYGEKTTDFEIEDEKSKIGISVFWEEKGPSPDIAECQKYDLPATSTPCAIGFLFSVLLGITQWMFN